MKTKGKLIKSKMEFERYNTQTVIIKGCVSISQQNKPTTAQPMTDQGYDTFDR